MRNLIKKILRESDDLDWIRNTQPIGYNDLKGKGLHFQPLIDNNEDLRRILSYLDNLGFDVGGHLNNLNNFDFEEDYIEGLYLNPLNDRIIWTGDLRYDGEEYEEHISDYAERPVEVLDGWQTLEGYL